MVGCEGARAVGRVAGRQGGMIADAAEAGSH